MFYIGVISGLIALFYPQEPMAKVDQSAEQLEIICFCYHHWMVLAVPLLMLFIMLNQIFQSELGFIPLRDRENFFGIDYKNTSYIWGPGINDAIGEFLALFTPDIFKTVPVGVFAGQIKY